VLKHFDGSLTKALTALYPQLQLKLECFLHTIEENICRDISGSSKFKKQKHREFLDEFARSNKFNPLDSEKWYNVTQNQIICAVRFSFASHCHLQV
jgi:hypothetical protein